jgi:5,10-methylene-tetrahydrofolate dehydrogenase/methenyl tetrahydrofolate cyclohydrolase
VQLPLPAGYRLRDILEAISLEKDVDGFRCDGPARGGPPRFSLTAP